MGSPIRSAIRWLINWPDTLARRTSAKQRRAIHFWLTVFWLGGGTLIWLYLRSALWLVGFMSLYAIWITHLAGWSAETPAEIEEDPPAEG